jgi:branched-chain amino acid transport system ATP-binding protein
MPDGLLTLKGVHTNIGRYQILQGVDFAVPAGSITMLLGRNGAGKTTALRTIMGLWRTSRGDIAFDGRDINRFDTPDIARLGIAYVPEHMGVFGGLTVAENLALAVREGPVKPDQLEWIWAIFPPLRTFWSLPAMHLSGGQKQMLSIARALAAPRRLILIDEPSKGLSPTIVQALVRALREIRARGATVLLVEQNFALAEAIGDGVVVMNAGHVVHRGAMAALAADNALQQTLLGLNLETAA